MVAHLRTRHLVLGAVLCLWLPALASCDLDPDPGAFKQDKIYVGGYMRNDGAALPCYWHNDEYVLLEVPPDRVSGYVNAIYVYGPDVYPTGYVVRPSFGGREACYWKNTTYHALQSISDSWNSEGCDIKVDSAKPYVAGYSTDES